MNLKDYCKNIYNKYGKVKTIIAVTLVILLIGIGIYSIIIVNKNQREKEQEAIQAQVHLEEQAASEKAQREQEEKERIKQEYTSNIDMYNTAVTEYNAKVNKINAFIDKIQEYDIIEQVSLLEPKDILVQNFDEFWNNGADLSDISNETNKIKEDTENLKEEYYKIGQAACNSAVNNYNKLANEYNELSALTSVDFIKDMDKKARLKDEITYEQILTCTEEMILDVISIIIDNTNELAEKYIIVSQITVPDEDWVISRLSNVKSITGKQAVTETNDPNGLLGKDNGYTSCVYFGVNYINSADVKGENIVAKGTDAGGAVEVYSTLDDALNRCEYLSQFDNTLLYSGSYVIVGTMVVRTSYKLSNKQQIDVTNEIINAFSEIE